jgi:hypothetical protein
MPNKRANQAIVRKQPRAKSKAEAKRKPGRKLSAIAKSEPRKTPFSHPYVKCLLGPVSMPSSGMGYPDGENALSIVVDFRQTITLTPLSGQLCFSFVSSPYGCVAVNTGVFTGVLPQFTGVSNLGLQWSGVTAHNLTPGYTTNHCLIPFAELTSLTNVPSLSGTPFGPYGVTKFRGLVNTADIYFTGSTMYDEGSVRIFRTQVEASTDTTVNVNTVTQQSMNYTPLSAGLGQYAGQMLAPARRGFNIRDVSSHPSYVSVLTDSITTGVVIAGENSSSQFITNMPWCGLDPEMPITVVAYTGLDATASITIDVRSCIEMVVSPGLYPGWAKPSPPTSSSLVTTISNIARSLPVASIVKAATGYMTGGVIGALRTLV